MVNLLLSKSIQKINDVRSPNKGDYIWVIFFYLKRKVTVIWLFKKGLSEINPTLKYFIVCFVSICVAIAISLISIRRQERKVQNTKYYNILQPFDDNLKHGLNIKNIVLSV